MSGSSRSFTPDEKEISGHGANVSVIVMIDLTVAQRSRLHL